MQSTLLNSYENTYVKDTHRELAEMERLCREYRLNGSGCSISCLCMFHTFDMEIKSWY